MAPGAAIVIASFIATIIDIAPIFKIFFAIAFAFAFGAAVTISLSLRPTAGGLTIATTA